ncbi:MAG: hypothetical protein H6826_14485 [Planctomycetes bacterium]|nr:hypothetical protein [Planctomycetota bacterium]
MPRHEEVEFYLVFRKANGGFGRQVAVAACKKRPAFKPTEIAVKIRTKIDMSIFTRPQIEADLELDDRHIQRPTIEIEPQTAEADA